MKVRDWDIEDTTSYVYTGYAILFLFIIVISQFGWLCLCKEN